jgi:hypothetical protein
VLELPQGQEFFEEEDFFKSVTAKTKEWHKHT